MRPPNLQSNGQSQDLETTADPAQNDRSKQISESNEETATAFEPIPQPPLRRKDTPSTHEINDPATEKKIRKANLVILEAVNTTYALILILITWKYTDIDECKTVF